MARAGTEEFIIDLKSRKYLNCDSKLVKLRGSEINVPYLIEHGFENPILIQNKEGLGMKVPDTSFTIPDVADFVGIDFKMDVIDVRKQESLRITVREFMEQFFAPIRSRLLNVLSLEFSKTRLAQLVSPPRVVRDLSLVEKYWPADEDLDRADEEGGWSRPSVQKYCLMSMSGSYTDFHIDFGGSSVWYHVLWGEKVFYLIPPTPSTLATYRRWYSLEDHHALFFPDLVLAQQQSLSPTTTDPGGLPALPVYRLRVRTGQTVLLPSGWIHAVYTPVDSLVFGGNFLHELGIPLQISIYRMELRLGTNPNFMFPYFEKLHWHVAEALLGKFKNYLMNKKSSPQHYLEGGKCLAKTLAKWLERRKKLPLENRSFYLPDRQHMELSYPEVIHQLILVLKSLGHPVVSDNEETTIQYSPRKRGRPASKKVSRQRNDSWRSFNEEDQLPQEVEDEEEEDPLPDLKDATLVGEHYYFPAGGDSEDEEKKKRAKRRKRPAAHKSASARLTKSSKTTAIAREPVGRGDDWKPSSSSKKLTPPSSQIPGTSNKLQTPTSTKLKKPRKGEATPKQRLAKKLGISRPF